MDWNGTLIEFPDEGRLWKHVGVGLLREAVKHRRPLRTAGLLWAMRKLRRLTEQYRAGRIDYGAIYDVFNPSVLRGVPVATVDRLTQEYAEKPETGIALNHDLLATVAGPVDIKIILSTGYRDGIRRVLRNRGYESVPTRIEANDLVVDSEERVDYFNHRRINKGQFLPGLLTEEEIDGQDTVYIGDRADDEGCFDIVAYPVLSHHATPTYRSQFQRRYPRGFVLEATGASYRDFDNFLRKN